MQARSALFDQTIANAHTVLVRADILSQGKVIASGLDVAGGSVSGSRSQFARGTCTAVLGDPGLKPMGQAGDLLAPYGNEIRLWRGALTPAGPELMCLGTFGIRSAEFDSGGAFAGVTVTGIDRCKRISETRFPYPRTSPPQASAIVQVQTLIREVIPFAEIRVDPDLVDATLPQVTWPTNRDQAITDIMASIGGEVFCDPYGAFVLQPVPSPAGEPVYTVRSGPGGVLVSAQHSLTRDGVFNAVIARGSTTSSDTDTVVSDLFTDSDPTSPTFYGGPFGEIVGFYESSLITDYEQANTAAQAQLLNRLGAARSINYSTAVNSALQLGDVVAVVDPDTGAAERHLQDQLTIGLGVGDVMTAQTRSTVNTSPVMAPQYTGSPS